jgi:hypothetical protein
MRELQIRNPHDLVQGLNASSLPLASLLALTLTA